METLECEVKVWARGPRDYSWMVRYKGDRFSFAHGNGAPNRSAARELARDAVTVHEAAKFAKWKPLEV